MANCPGGPGGWIEATAPQIRRNAPKDQKCLTEIRTEPEIPEPNAHASPWPACTVENQKGQTTVSEISEAETSAVSRAAAPFMAQEWLTFRLGAEEYGIDILRVQEIRSYEQPTRIANAPEFIKGVVNLRGVIVPIFDLRMKLGSGAARYDNLTVTIVLNVNGHIVGAVVDSVSDVLELGAGDIKPFPEMSSVIETGFISGIGSVQTEGRTRMLILMDIVALVAGTDLIKLTREA
jgi:purine-binding chemotaxis protein CheW